MEKVKRVLARYDSGISVVFLANRLRAERLYGEEFHVISPEYEVVVFSGFRTDRERSKALLLAELLDRAETDLIQEVRDRPTTRGREVIPLSIALLNKPAIASYLWVFEDLEKEEIATKMDVKKSTVQQYLTRFKS